MAYHRVEDGPWPVGTTVTAWPEGSVVGGVPQGLPASSAVASANGVAEFGGLTEGATYTAFGHGGTQTFAAANQEERIASFETRIVALETQTTDFETRLDALEAVPPGPVPTLVRLATTTNIANLNNGPAAVDGVTLVFNDRVLVKNQSAPAQNGIYTYAGGPPHELVRAADGDAWEDLPGTLVLVQAGAQQATQWLCTAALSGTLGTTAVTWVQV